MRRHHRLLTILTAGNLLIAALVGALLVSSISIMRAPAHATPTATATASSSPTLTATPTATPEPVAYRVTWYGDDFAGGPMLCTEEPYDPNDPTVAASGAGGPPCGERLRLCSEGTCIEVTIRDGCGGCGPQHLDLSRAGWEALGKPSEVWATPVPPVLPPTPVPGGNLSALALPDDTTVNTSGCARDGFCRWFNFYWSPTHEIVLQGDEPVIRRVHETCHAHQHWSINGGAPTREDLSAWYATAEAASFSAIATDWPYPYAFTTAQNRLEDFAEACALWYVDPARLLTLSPARYTWMAATLP